MPYKLKHQGSGFKVTSPNHPQGFSKHPLSKQKALAQLRIIKANAQESLPEMIVSTLLNEQFPPLGFKQQLSKRNRRDQQRKKLKRGTNPKAIYFSGVGYTGAGMHPIGGGGSGPGIGA